MPALSVSVPPPRFSVPVRFTVAPLQLYDPNAASVNVPPRLTVATGSCRYMGEMALKIAVWRIPAEHPTRAIPATRHQGENGGDTKAR